MFVSGWPFMLLFFCLFGSVSSFPVSIYTPATIPSSQISPPSSLQSYLPYFPSTTIHSPSSHLFNSSEASIKKARCPLKISPSTLVVRFGDSFTVNCSVLDEDLFHLGWAALPESWSPPHSGDDFLVWNVDRMTEWSMKLMCYALSNREGQCDIALPVIVYKPPDSVSISFSNHSGPMSEGHEYTLQCEVQNVAPVENLTVTFYKGQTVLGQLRSNNTEKTPVTENFTLSILPSKEDVDPQYWCEAMLKLGPEGPQTPPMVMSQKLNATVHFGPHINCPTKLHVREGERLICEVSGNPQPSVTWLKNGHEVVLPTHSSREHSGEYIISTKGHLGQKNFSVKVEVLPGSGTANNCNRYFLLAIFLIQTSHWL